MQLRDYIDSRGQTIEEFAAAHGFSVATLKKWTRGERTPRPKAMQAIKAATCGKVSADDFHEGRAA